MKIIEKEIKRRGRSVSLVELIPEKAPEMLRIKWGLIGLAMVLGAACLYLVPEGNFDRFRTKGVIILGALGCWGILWALSRVVYRGIVNREVKIGRRFLGMTMWTRRMPLAEDLSLDISRNEAAEIFVKMLEPEGDLIHEIGPFIDGDQAVTACGQLRPRKMMDEEMEEADQAVAREVIRDLEGPVKPWFLQMTMLIILAWLIFTGWRDENWIDAAITGVIGFGAVLAGIAFLAPISGVYYDSDDGESVEYWNREGWFHRMDFKASLVKPTAPEFLKRRFHFPTLGWLSLVPVYLGIVVLMVMY